MDNLYVLYVYSRCNLHQSWYREPSGLLTIVVEARGMIS
jgi:hypothetical protein